MNCCDYGCDQSPGCTARIQPVCPPCTGDCNQGRSCNAARETGNVCIATPEPTVKDALFFWACVTLLAVISTAVIFRLAGYLYTKFGDTLQRLFWSAMTLWF